MPAMTKRVNVRANVAVRNINPPIHGTCNDIIMTTGDILKCLCKRAHVEEILPNGTTVTLNMKNYFTDNGAGLFVKKEKQQHVEVKKPEPEKADKAPEVPETPVVETADEKKEEKPEESVTPPAESETKPDDSESAVDESTEDDENKEDKSNEEAAGVSEEKKDEEEIPTATSGYVAIVGEETGAEAATVTVSASTESKTASTKKSTSSKSNSKKSSSSKKK